MTKAAPVIKMLHFHKAELPPTVRYIPFSEMVRCELMKFSTLVVNGKR